MTAVENLQIDCSARSTSALIANGRPSAKRNSSYSTYSILFITYTSYFGDKKGISRNKMKFFFLMLRGSATS